MKKFFLFAAIAAAVSFTSCSNDDDLTTVSNPSASGLAETPISFVTDDGKPVTRAGDVTSLTSFKVTGVTSTGATYFSNETFSFANSMFSSSTPYYWPVSGTMDFYAANSGTINYASGAASLSVVANDGTTDYVTAVSKAISKATTVPLTFKHIMSRLTVKVKPYSASDGYDYQITSVKAYVKGSGKYTFGSTTGTVGSWSDLKDYKTYTWTTGLPATTGKSNSAKVISLTQAFYVLPATTSSDMITFDVDFKVYKNGVLVADHTGENCGTVDINDPGLVMGKSICYILEPSFTGDDAKPIAFTATVTPWGATTDIDSDYEM